jgi:AcrR family transcriptional regulator
MTASAARSSDPSPATRRLRGHERRESILAAAAAAFARTGFAATSIADVSATAGVSHLIVYRHFESKEALYNAVLRRAIEHLDVSLSAPGAVGRYGPTPGALLRSARAAPDAFTVLWRHAAREPSFVDAADDARSRLVRATRDALADRVEPSQRRWAARAAVAYLVESVLVWIEDGDERLDDRFVAATDAATRAGVRAWSRPTH